MVARTDKTLDLLSNGNYTVDLLVATDKSFSNEPCYHLTRKSYSLMGGATYEPDDQLKSNGSVWLCPVTLLVMHNYPKELFFAPCTEKTA